MLKVTTVIGILLLTLPALTGCKHFSTRGAVAEEPRWRLLPTEGFTLPGSMSETCSHQSIRRRARGTTWKAIAMFTSRIRPMAARELLSPETVRGTPALASHNDNSIALWQTSETAETKMRALGTTGSALSVATNAELPAAAYVKEKLFVAYIATEKEKRSIWLIRAG